MEFEKLKQVIAEVLSVDPDEITMETTFVDDLGADSLDLFQIIMGLEEAFDIEIPTEKAEKITTVEEAVEETAEATDNATEDMEAKERELLKKGVRGYYSKKDGLEVQSKDTERKVETKEQEVVGDINPYTGKEYKSNSVRMHPKRIGYVQVYDQEQHKWTDMTEWAFLGYQERKKALLGKDYVPPIYLD